jgi:hypothetical protein
MKRGPYAQLVRTYIRRAQTWTPKMENDAEWREFYSETHILVWTTICNSIELYWLRSSACGHAVAGFPQRPLEFEPGSGHVWFVVDKVALGQVLSNYFGLPANLHSTSCSTVTVIYHLVLVQWASSGRSTKWTQSHPTNDKKV